MIKASALTPLLSVETSKQNYVRERIADSLNTSRIIKNNQNIVIESVSTESELPKSVQSLAARILENESLMRDILCEFRTMYISKRSDFHISLSEKTAEEKETVIKILQSMYGIVSQLHYSQYDDVLNGRLALIPKTQAFITGSYLETVVFEQIDVIVRKLSAEYGRPYTLYKNVRLATTDGQLKNEFDVVLDFGGVFYAVEIKSGKQFRDFEKYVNIGREYNIVPNRFILADSCMSDEQAEMVEYFCEYYVTNLKGNSLEEKITEMILNDIKGED